MSLRFNERERERETTKRSSYSCSYDRHRNLWIPIAIKENDRVSALDKKYEDKQNERSTTIGENLN
jgi:hypothetical protein